MRRPSPEAQKVLEYAELLGLTIEHIPGGGSGKRAVWRFSVPGESLGLGEASGDTAALAWLRGYAVGRRPFRDAN